MKRESMFHRRCNRIHCRLGAILLLALAGAGNLSAQTLLSYWDFNNVSPGYSGSTVGAFSATTTPLANGEYYNAANKTLSANSANGAVYSSGISLNLSGVGGTANGSYTVTSTGFGAFTDSGLNAAAGDATTGGSLIITTGSGTSTNFVLALNTTGYTGLNFSYAQRLSTSGVVATWSYSTDGTNYTALGSQSTTAGTWATVSFSLPTELGNLGTVYLKMTDTFTGGSQNVAFDNIQLTGIAVPEPGAFALVTGFLALSVVARARRRAV